MPTEEVSVSKDDIARYYDTQQIFYTLFWSRTALHYGFWYQDTKSLSQAVLNTNNFVIDTLAIDSGDTVLDAGCGVGGTSIHIAETTGARVHGITLSDVQLRIARKRAGSSSAAHLLNFSKGDFTQTLFTEKSFSRVFGIESICYAKTKTDFLNEAYRIMMPGGMIAIVDLFLAKHDFDVEEMKIYTKTIEGWTIPNLATVSDFWTYLEHAGFNDISFFNMLPEIKKSSRRMYFQKLLWSPVDLILSRFSIGRENVSAKYQRPFFDRGIGVYGVFIATKT
ncbi:MAG: class I SAM-dependent methyltransferase [Acidobacteriota bacterium]